MESASAAGVEVVQTSVEEQTLWDLLSNELYDFYTASSEAQLPSTSTGSPSWRKGAWRNNTLEGQNKKQQHHTNDKHLDEPVWGVAS